MPKDFTDYLHEATKDTLKDNVESMAHGWDKSTRYIYKILAEESSDSFPPFLAMYEGACKGGVSTCHWDNELEYTRQKFAKNLPVRSEAECFAEKMQKHSSTVSKFMQFIADGKLTLEEIAELEDCLNKEEQNIELIRTMLNFRKAGLEK